MENGKRGGARTGAGRKKGGTNSVKKANARPEILYLRMTTEQKEMLRAASESAGMKMSDYVVFRVFGKQ